MSIALDPHDDTARGYDLAIAAIREMRVRARVLPPHPGDAREARWAGEGPVPIAALDVVQEAVAAHAVCEPTRRDSEAQP